MVQWTDKPARKPQAAPGEIKPAPVVRAVRKARRSRLAGVLQVLTILCMFGLVVAGVFMFRDMRAGPEASAAGAAPIMLERDSTTGRIVMMESSQCRELGFDNHSGKMVQKGAVACHDTPVHHAGTTGQSLYRHPTTRLEHIRRSFAQ
jgi:hypothetical protein